MAEDEDEEEWPYERNLVIDNGSYCIKAGFAGNDQPSSRGRTVITQPMTDDAEQNEVCIKYAMDHGMITSPERMELLWYHTFKNELKVDPSTRRVLITHSVQNTKCNADRIAQIMFETFQPMAIHIEDQSVLSLYASGRTTGIVLSAGDGVIQTVPIYEGYQLSAAVRRTSFAGRHVTDYLMQLLNEKGYTFSTSMERELVRDIKEKYGYIALDYKAEIDKWESSVGQSDMEKKYELPDRTFINLNVERFKCAEMLFQPHLFGIDHDEKGIHELVFDSISACDVDTRRDMYHNIVLSGGTTMWPGMRDRMKSELSVLMNKSGINMSSMGRAPYLVAAPDRRDYAWIGGSILASLTMFNNSGWTTREEYNEIGDRAIHRYCQL